ncbi:MAG TPA: hypothetical protein VG709_04695, partial [Actinomycetota bacterium]|nr:hypothetical protein [Actinomycetota bacterium]
VRPDERLIEATAVGGVFVDQSALVRTGRSADAVVRGLRAARASDGRALFADVFPGRAVTFARYC